MVTGNRCVLGVRFWNTSVGIVGNIRYFDFYHSGNENHLVNKVDRTEVKLFTNLFDKNGRITRIILLSTGIGICVSNNVVFYSKIFELTILKYTIK